MLFTDKPKGIPLLAKGLSNSFNGKMKFGLIRKEAIEVVEHFGVKKFPTILLHKQGAKKPEIYSGEIKFQPLFDFLNIHSEQFVPKSSSNSDEEEKTWVYEILPELHVRSIDLLICFNSKYFGGIGKGGYTINPGNSFEKFFLQNLAYVVQFT